MKGMSLDRISTLPQPILETILCLLPIEEAARTSILSREWRYKWTRIPKVELYDLLFDDDDYNRSKLLDVIDQILLLRQSPIHELTLYIEADYDYSEFDQIILNLSRNHTVKKLTLVGPEEVGSEVDSTWCKLPISIFSLHHLTDLSIGRFDLDYPPIFNGFDSLQSLYLRGVGISAKTLLHLLSSCPSLKSFSLLIFDLDYDDKCTINELIKCLPVIEHLTTFHRVSKWLLLDSVPQELPTSLIHLKYICFNEIRFDDGYGLGLLFVLIKCSPNLEKIKLEIPWDQSDVDYNFVWEEYSDVWLEHLNELEIINFCNSKPEMELVKFILARSPKLKKVSIRCIRRVHRRIESEIEMLKTLLQAPRVSPVVITVK